jgi:hypothetical protein
MKFIELSEVSALVPLLHSGSPEPLIATENGATVAAIVPANEQDVEDLLLSVNPRFQAILEKSRDRLKAEGGVSSAEVRKRLGMPPADEAS